MYSLAKAGEDNCFFSADGNGWIVQWNLNHDENGRLVARMHKPVYCISYQSTQNLIWAGTMTGEIARLDPQGNTRLFQAHNKAVYGFMSLDEHHFFSYGGDGQIILWDEEANILNRFSPDPAGIRQLLYYNNKLFVGLTGGKLLQCNPDGSDPIPLHHFKGTLFGLEASPPFNCLYAAGRDAHLYQLENGKGYAIKQAIPAHLQSIHCVKANGKGLLASSSMDKTLKLWDANTLALLKVIDKTKFGIHNSSVNHLLWLNERTLISASDDRQLGVFEVERVG